MSQVNVVLLAFIAALVGGCAAPRARRAAPSGGTHATQVPGVSPAELKACSSRVDFGSHDSASWVEDRRQRLCCASRNEGVGTHFDAWHLVGVDECVSRYAPGLRLPFVDVPDSAATGQAARVEDCLPGIAVEVLIPTAELEARIELGTRLHIESCVAEQCSRAALDFDPLARADQLLFALEGTPKTGAIFVWNAGMIRLRLRVVQPREQAVTRQRYRLTLNLDGTPLRSFGSVLVYDSPTAVVAGVDAGSSLQCPFAVVTLPPP